MASPRPAPAAAAKTASLGAWLARRTLLQWAFGVSVALHVVLLSVRFVDPEAFNRAFQDTPLEVILVNAKSGLRPEVAQAIAQVNLAGGGEHDKGRAKSPLPAADLSTHGDAADDAHRRVEELQEVQSRLLAQVKAALAQRPEEFQAMSDAPDATAQEERRRKLEKLLAEIEARINEENRRPRKKFISPATREAVYAQYYDALKRKVEAKGTKDFPEINGQKLYGELMMVMLVDKSGRLLKAEVVQSSGNRRLDRMAEAIAASASPFGAFNAEMRRQADQVEVVSRFKFARDETLKASLEAQQQQP
ncbi:MAG: TonB family protein [Betaproteobacteria bacterium]|nr:TonB family protein [Betaproteobacteria bacterium]